MRVSYIGLDIETMSLDGPPIEIGLAIFDGIKLVGWSRHIPWDQAVVTDHWDEESALVHGLDPYVSDDYRVLQAAAILDARDWIASQLPRGDRTLIPVGKQIGSFDRRILRAWMPNFDALFNYRSIELNTAMRVFAGMTGQSFNELKSGAMANTHGAGSDAMEALAMWRLIQSSFR